MSEHLPDKLFLTKPVSANSPRVVSDQAGVHDMLHARIERYRASESLRPIPAHSATAFQHMHSWLTSKGVDPKAGRLIFDSGCGRGDSSLELARQYPERVVIGVDKSIARLDKLQQDLAGRKLPENLLLVRADLRDIYRQMADASWRVGRHYLFYPNPWPKSVHMGRRWHASDVWPSMMALGGYMELRTNWRIYAEEYVVALAHYGVEAVAQPVVDDSPISLHERKYMISEHELWQVAAEISINSIDF